VTAAYRKRAQAMDDTKINAMKAAERKCCKLTSQYILPCSPEIQRIIRLRRAYRGLRGWIEGRSKNSNIIRAALRAGIERPWCLTLEQCIGGERTCAHTLRSLEKTADNLRREHLGDRLLIARRRGDKTKDWAIHQIMTQEKAKDEWKRIKFAIGTPFAGATTKIQKLIDGEVVDITDTDVMKKGNTRVLEG
jgi:hypothetical protein